tara:strand:- start:239 stop:478 length:240 start_codon:yes stop_codon:yes gene_type:complete
MDLLSINLRCLMKELIKIIIYIVSINLIFIGTLISQSNSEEKVDIGNEKESSEALSELENLETKTTLSMDKEIVFPRDI